MITKTKKTELTLSPVERRILGCIEQGMTNEEIGEIIGKSKWTVKFHLGKVMKKLGVNTRVQAVSYAMGHGDIAPSGTDDFLFSEPGMVFRAGIVGCGKKGAALLASLKDKPLLKIEWVFDEDLEAPGIKLAKEAGIEVVTELGDGVRMPLDMIIDMSGSDAVAKKISRLKDPKTELLTGLSSRLMLMVGYQHEKNRTDHRFSVSAADKLMIEGLGNVVGNVHGVKDLASAIVAIAMRLTGSSAGLVAICDEAREYMTLVATSGYSRSLTELRSWKIRQDGITARALDRDTPLLIPDLSEFPVSSPVLEREGVRSMMVTPLTVNGKLVGMMQVSDVNHGRYTYGELSLFSLFNVYAGRFLNKARELEDAQLKGVRDTLTGLYDRAYIMEQLRLEICRASRHDSNLTLLVINVDNYRTLLRTHGSIEVNRLLRAIGGYLKRNLRDIDIAARIHEGEFCILTPELGAAGAKLLSDRLVRELRAMPDMNGVGFKAGLAVYPEDGLLKRELIKKVGTTSRSKRDTLTRRCFNPTQPKRRPVSL